ncbi:hypothetical protein LMG10661_02669 [Ralstonia syzygii subsp. syzygii]|nr:hypothetical protein LMG10661_02669 [Ralstonia syzygii subsp. syzygii]
MPVPVDVITLSSVRSGAGASRLRAKTEPVPRRAHRDEPRERRRHEHPGERRYTHPR